MKAWPWIVVTSALLAVPAPVDAQPDTPSPASSHVYREIGDQALHAYVFQPPARRADGKAPAILLFHGGGWSAGGADWVFPRARRFADLGLVAIAIQYRLSEGEVTPVDALGDACAAFQWVRAHAAELGLSGLLAGYGVSAGGQLVAATVTIGCPQDGLAGRPVGPDALLLWSPALDLVDDGWFSAKLQGRATAAALSPARHVGPATPPTSIVHGECDTLSPLRGVQRYCAQLAEQGRPCDLHVYAGLGHLLTRNLAQQEGDYDPDPKARADGMAQQELFLRKQGFLPEIR